MHDRKAARSGRDPERSHAPRAPRETWRRAFAATALFLALLQPSCATAIVWKRVPEDRNGDVDWHAPATYGALALTPVTVAVDLAIPVLFVWAMTRGFAPSFDWSEPAPRFAPGAPAAAGPAAARSRRGGTWFPTLRRAG